MVRLVPSVHITILLYISLVTQVSSLTLSPPKTIAATQPTVPIVSKGQPKDQPKGSPETTTTSSPTSRDGVVLYRYISSKTGTTCILMRTDALVEVKFQLHHLEESADSFIPEKALVDGNCKNEDESEIRISWTGYNLVIGFAKTPGGERWYIDNVELTVSPDLRQLQGIQSHGKAIKLYHRQMLIPTPVGKSYSCDELDIDLFPDEDDHPPPGVHGSLLLRSLQLQPFMYKNEYFEPAVECRGLSSFRSETAPIAVGSTLALAVLLTVAGYAAFRYFKIKNVQYNTME